MVAVVTSAITTWLIGLFRSNDNSTIITDDFGKPLPEKYTKRQLDKLTEGLHKLRSDVDELSLKVTGMNQVNKEVNKVITAKETPKEPCRISKSTTTGDVDEKYTYLRVVGIGRLESSQRNENTIYRMWKENNKIFYEFNSVRVKKFIKNRTVFIDSFCNKDIQSVEPAIADEIQTLSPGELNEDLTVKTKVTILYK